MVDKEVEQIFIGSKDISKYLSACFYSLGRDSEVLITARGNNIKRAIDIVAILIRQYLNEPEYSVVIGSEKFEERHVSTIDIHVKGQQKEIEK